MNLGIIVGSVREGRLADRVVQWLITELGNLQTEYTMLDIKDYDLPLLDMAVEPHNADKKYNHDEVTKWSEAVSSCNAYIIVTAEYNHGYPAALKNGLDWLYPEWYNKPVGFVSYSTGPVGGARVIEHLLPVVNHLGMHSLSTAISIGKAQDVIDQLGKTEATYLADMVAGMVRDLDSLVDNLSL